MARQSLRISKKGLEFARAVLAQQALTKKALASDLNLSWNSVDRFFKGQPIEHNKFLKICKRLGIDWQETAEIDNYNFLKSKEDSITTIEQAEQAIAYYEAALQLRKGKLSPDWAETQKKLGQLYSKLIRGSKAENLERSIYYYQAALQVYTRKSFPENWAEIQKNLGLVYTERIQGEEAENLEQAIARYQDALQIYTREAFPYEWARTQTNLGNAYSDRILGDKAQNLERAIASLTAALEVFTRDAFPQSWAEIQNKLGLVYRKRIQGENSENIEQAIACYKAALQIYTREVCPQDWAKSRMSLANAYRNRILGNHLENLELAIANYKQALGVLQEASDRYSQGIIHHQLGGIYQELREYELARQNYEQALEILCEHGEQISQADTAYQLGLIAKELGNFDEARKKIQHAIGILQKIDERYSQARLYYQLGLANQNLQEYEVAQHNYLNALDICVKYSDRYLQGIVYHQLGNLEQEFQNIKEAQRYYYQAIEIYTELDERIRKVNSLNSLGDTYYYLGKYQQSIECYQQSLEITREIRDRQIEADSLGKLGNAYYYLGQYQQAVELHSQMLEIVQQIGTDWDEANALINLSNAYCSLERYSEAVELLERSLSLAETIEDEYQKAILFSNVSQALLRANNFERAIAVAQGVPDSQKRLEVLKNVIEVVNGLEDELARELLAPLHQDPDEKVRQALLRILQAPILIPISRIEALKRIKFVRGSVLELDVDAVVHPTGPNLDFTGSLGRQIYERLGFEQIRKLSHQSTETVLGKVVVSSTSHLSARYLLHMPVHDARTYPPTITTVLRGITAALSKAEDLDNVRTIAFPSVGGGNAGLNPDDIAVEALRTVANYLVKGSQLESVVFAFVGESGYQAYVSAYRKLILQSTATYYVSLIVLSQSVQVGGVSEVSVRLSQSESGDNNSYLMEFPDNEAIGGELNIILNAPSFQFDGDNAASLPLDLSAAQVAQTATFRLTALRTGSATITAELYRGDTFETNLETEVQVTGFDEASLLGTRITTQPRPVPQPDFILRVQTAWNETNSACKFYYQLRSFRLPSLFSGETNYYSESLSSCWIEQMRGLLATTLENISEALPEDGRSHLTSLGQYLFQHLLPSELQTDFRNVIPRDRTFTLLILADQDASLPWELLHDGQRFLSDRFIIGRWFWELNDTRPHEFPVGAINVAHYADVEQPELWTDLLEPPGSPPPLPLPEGVLSNLDSTEAMRGLHLIRYSQSSDATNRRNAPVTLDDTNNAQDIERQMRPAKLNLRRNRPLVSLGYVRRDHLWCCPSWGNRPELTTVEQTWASAFIRAGCSAFTGSLWAVDPAVEAAFISGFYNRLWTGDSLGEAFHASRQLARAVAPDSLDWLAYVLFGDPMARPYRPVEGKGYAVVEPIGREIDDPLPPGVPVRFRLSLRRTPPVWHEERVIEVAENLTFENLQAHVKTFGLQVTPDSPIAMSLAPTGNYLGWFTLVAPPEMAGNSALVQVFLMDGMLPVHSLMFSLTIENEGGD